MRIGIVTTWFERGAAYVSKQYEDILKKQGNEVFIYARSGEKYAIGDKNWDKENVYWSKRYSFPIFNYTDSKELVQWAKNNKIDTVIFNEQYWLPNVIALKNIGVKVGAYIDYYTEDMLPTFNVYDFLLCNTKKHFSVFKDLHSNALYLPWGTDINLYNTSALRESSEKIRFFHSAGMSSYRKGTDLAVRAFLLLDEEYLKQCELIIHTQRSPFCDLTEDEKIKVDNYIEKGFITVIDKTVSAPGLYHLGDVYIYPSRLDGIGLTITEAIASGMPVVVPNDKPMNEFVTLDSYQVEINKFFCRSDAYYWPMNEVDINDLGNAYIYYINNKYNICNFSVNALEFSEKELSFENNMKNLSNVIMSSSKVNLSHEILISCVKFNEKRFFKIIKFEMIYRNLFSVLRR